MRRSIPSPQCLTGDRSCYGVDCLAYFYRGAWLTLISELTPIGADQPENARRCTSLGLARVLDEATLDPSIARAAVLETLANPTCRANAEKLRAEIHGLPGPDQTVALLERLASGQDLVLPHR